MLRVSRLAAMRLYRTQIPRMAAALAYRTIFGLIPVMAISLIIFGALLDDKQLQSGVQQSLKFFSLDQIVVDQQKLTDLEREIEPLEEGEMGPPAPIDVPEAPPSTERLDQLVADLVEGVGASIKKIPNVGIAIISLLVLAYAAISMLVEIEKSFNQVYHAPNGRPWLRRFLLYWAMLTLGSGMLVATFYVGEMMKSYAISMASSTGYLATVIGFLMTVLISAFLFAAAYMTMPNTRVRWRSAIAGAIIAAVLWEMGKWGFRSYIEYSVGYARIYGSLAVLPLFLLWVYVTWGIVLFGLQVAYTLQTIGEWEDDSDGVPGMIDPAVALAVATSVASRFHAGDLATRDAVAQGCGLTDRITAAILESLEQQGIVHLVERHKREGYALAAPPERLKAAAILAATSAMVRDADGEERPVILDRLVAARVETLGELTLADLIPKASEPSVSEKPDPDTPLASD